MTAPLRRSARPHRPDRHPQHGHQPRRQQVGKPDAAANRPAALARSTGYAGSALTRRAARKTANQRVTKANGIPSIKLAWTNVIQKAGLAAPHRRDTRADVEAGAGQAAHSPLPRRSSRERAWPCRRLPRRLLIPRPDHAAVGACDPASARKRDLAVWCQAGLRPTERPPSRIRICPLTWRVLGSAKNATAWATSLGSSSRPPG
jgi:hypothetical protein